VWQRSAPHPHRIVEAKTMNRQKKLQQLFKAKAKKANAKLAPKRKSTYVNKADRLKLAAEVEAAAQNDTAAPTP
jgi:transcription initiation factor TFIIIB Brf1 subunit/transcription initiation factor TFIIB